MPPPVVPSLTCTLYSPDSVAATFVATPFPGAITTVSGRKPGTSSARAPHTPAPTHANKTAKTIALFFMANHSSNYVQQYITIIRRTLAIGISARIEPHIKLRASTSKATRNASGGGRAERSHLTASTAAFAVGVRSTT